VETVAFVGHGDVWLIRADGSGERHLGLNGVQSFAWISPTELDVVAGTPSPRHLLVDIEGHQREVPSPPGGSWSSDGTRYAVSVAQAVRVFDRDGALVVALKVGPSVDDCGRPPPQEPRLRLGRPAFGRDGREILVAVACWKDAGAYNFPATVYEASLDGASNARVAGLRANLRELTAPRPSPDGRGIAQAEGGGSSLCPFGRGLNVKPPGRQDVVALTGGLFQTVQRMNPGRNLFGGVDGYDWSPGSDALVLSFNLSFCDLNAGLKPAVAALFRFRWDGSAEQKLVQGETHSPAWSPLGDSIVYVAGSSRESPTGPITVLDLSTGKARVLGQGAEPAWQPAPPTSG